MKRPELTDEMKVELLENIIARLFGHWGNVKVDWEQRYGYMGPSLTLKNVDLDRERLGLLEDLRGIFDLEFDTRAIVDGEGMMIPMSGGKDLTKDRYFNIHTEIDLQISPNYETYLINQTSEEMKDIRKRTSSKWTEQDEEERNHRYFSPDEGGALHPTLFRFKNTPEQLKERIESAVNHLKYLKKELKKTEARS